MLPTPDRIDWDLLKRNYPKWESKRKLDSGCIFGSVSTLLIPGRWVRKRFLIALLEEPEWAMDMFNTYLDMCISLYEQIWDAGYRI